jgi:glycosyltransferase involved in cell wall biosynthesis
VAKLLIIAPTCDRTDVGEAWVAYQWASRLSERHDATILTYHKRSRPPVAEQIPHARVIEWSEPAGLGKAERLNSMLKPGYIPFYIRARRWIKRAVEAGERFDVAHQPVPVAMRYPSPVVGLGIPFVIGPVGGGLSSPPGFEAEDKAPWYVNLRRFDSFRMRHDRLLRRTYSEAGTVLGIADYVGEILESVPVRRLEIMSETGIEALPPEIERTGREAQEVRLLYVGRLIRTKGARDAIRAMSQVGDRRVVLDIVGDGFDRGPCEELVRELGIESRVRFHGTQPRDKVDEFYRAADVFVFPSYREPGGNVAYEAMAAGLPLIVSDRGGPGAAVDESCGRRIRPTEPNAYAQDIAAAIVELVDDQALRLELGRNARARVANTALWDRKIDYLDKLYAEL